MEPKLAVEALGTAKIGKCFHTGNMGFPQPLPPDSLACSGYFIQVTDVENPSIARITAL